RIRCNQPHSNHLLRLSDPVSSVNRLIFYRRIPPWIYQVYIVGLRQVQTGAPGFQTHQEYRYLRIVLKLVYNLFTIYGRPRQIRKADRSPLKLCADEVEHPHKLRKYENLMPWNFSFNLLEQHVDLSRLATGKAVFFQQCRGVANLPQARKSA